MLSQRTGPKGITPAGRAWKGIFQQEAVDSPGPKMRELVRDDGAWLRTVLPAGWCSGQSHPGWTTHGAGAGVSQMWGHGQGGYAHGAGRMSGEACLSPPISLAKTGKYRISNQSMLSTHLPPQHHGKLKLVICFLESMPKYV